MTTALGEAITVTLPHTANDAAALQREAEADWAVVRTWHVTDAETYTAADETLSDAARRLDALERMRTSVTAPLLAVKRTVDAWFAPGKDALESIIAHLKSELGTYRVKQLAAERKAREEAAKAATAGDGQALLTALTVAEAAGQAPEGRSTTTFVWVVDRIAADMLPAEWLVPDEKRIAAHARAWRGEDAPVIPGVTFRREAKIGARR